jgi:ATPase family protein associated with various cellular activities (AAA)
MSADLELCDRLERVRVLLAHAFEVRVAMVGGAGDGRGAVRALERFVRDNVEPGFVPRPAHVAEALAAVDRTVAERTAAGSRLGRLTELLGLDPLEIDLLLVALAAGVRRGFREALLMIGPENAPGVHPAAHLIEVVAWSAESYAAARAAVGDGGRLLGSGALLAHADAPGVPTLWRSLAPSPVVRAWLDGAASPYPLLDDDPEIRRLVDDDVAARLAATLPSSAGGGQGGGPPHLALIGARASGRTRAAAWLAHRLGVRALQAPARDARPAALDARLRERLVFIDTGDGAELPADLAAALAGVPAPVALAALPGAPAAAALARAGFTRVDVPAPSLATQVRAWQAALASDAPAIADLVRGHALELGAIEEAAAQARADAGTDPARLLPAAERAARARTSDRLAAIADRLSTTLSWDDLVLPEDVREAVDEVWRAAAAREHVYERWGFGARTPYGRAISVLLSGEPGTGKTMVATLIARQLGVELYRVDLSRLVDKYIGETEKHLATLFAEAERGRCVLLFDEADALFGKRTKSGDSATERYANLEVNYLLQRIETFSGIVVLTTNQESMMDDAFKRRIRYRVEFPFPDEDDRALLWKRLLGAAPLAPDLDIDGLARRFPISGGHIKSAVLRAAFAAAAAAEPISNDRLVHAATQELAAIGRLS